MSTVPGPVPRDFKEEIERTRKQGSWGDLRLLAEEAVGFGWQDEGLRLVVAVQVGLGDLEGARWTWNAVEGRDGDLAGEVGRALAGTAAPNPAGETRDSTWVVVFSGHRLDSARATVARFPPAKVEVARRAVRRALLREKDRPGGVRGIAGGADGGDILFHEVCEELGVASELFLAVPPQPYVRTSVKSEDPEWARRFHRLCGRQPTRVLCPSGELPAWLRGKPDYSIWQRANRWMLHHAWSAGPRNVTLLALWDGRPGRPGGTEDMVGQVRARGGRRVILDTRKMFKLGDEEA